MDLATEGTTVGIFRKKYREPRVHPEAERTITLTAPLDAVIAQIDAYGTLHSERHAMRHQLVLSEHGGEISIGLPSRVHPWTFHNLGFWLLDTPNGGEGTVLRSSATSDHPAYTLVRDPELDDCFCGLDENGDGWTVSVPTNDVVRPGAVPLTRVPTPRSSGEQQRIVTVLMEDPGHDLNPSNAPTARTRQQLRVDMSAFIS